MIVGERLIVGSAVDSRGRAWTFHGGRQLAGGIELDTEDSAFDRGREISW